MLEGEVGFEEAAAMEEFEVPTAKAPGRGRARGRGRGSVRGSGLLAITQEQYGMENYGAYQTEQIFLETCPS